MLVIDMNNSLEFKDVNDLYNRVKPALYSKIKELRGLGYKHLTETDIWNYLVSHDWKDKKGLLLSDLISDILYCDNNALNDYVSNKINQKSINEEEIL